MCREEGYTVEHYCFVLGGRLRLDRVGHLRENLTAAFNIS